MAVALLPVAPIVHAAALNKLPAELLLNIIPRVPYSPHKLTCLRLTCSKFNDLIKQHEYSLVKEICSRQISQDQKALFPSLSLSTWTALRTLYQRLETLDAIHGQWLKIVNHSVELGWLKGEWGIIHKVGLLLLYRVHDASSYKQKVALLQTLPATSLACLLFKLTSSIKILRVLGPEPINASHARDDTAARSDAELALEELLLLHGPDFFVLLLGSIQSVRRQWAISALNAEVAGMDNRQTPLPNDCPKPPTLISTLRCSFAVAVGIDVSQTVSKMWEILSGTAFDKVDHAKLVSLVEGKEIEKGLKRMGF